MSANDGFIRADKVPIEDGIITAIVEAQEQTYSIIKSILVTPLWYVFMQN